MEDLQSSLAIASRQFDNGQVKVCLDIIKDMHFCLLMLCIFVGCV